MPLNDNVQLERRGGETPETVQALFKQCERREKEITPEKLATGRKQLIRELAFRGNPFPKLSAADATIGRAELYESLVALLKKASTDDSFWYVLAQWLRSEGIRAGEFLAS